METDIENILAQLAEAAALEPTATSQPATDSNREPTTGRFVKGNKASKGAKPKKKTAEQTEVPALVLPHEQEELPIVKRNSKGHWQDAEAAEALRAKTYKRQLREAIKKQAPASAVVSIMVANAMQTDDRRLAQEACRDLLDRVLGKPTQSSKMHYTGQPQHMSINITALPAAEQEQFLQLSGKLLAQDMGDRWGDEVVEAELLPALSPETQGDESSNQSRIEP